jgi:hypothetical protein
MIRKTVVVALLVLSFIETVQAQDRKAVREACRSDYAKFCSDVQIGGGRVLQCLRAHDAELVPACRDGLTALKPAR